MSFDELLKRYKAKTCILSVEKLDDKHFGNIRVVAGNKAHCNDIEQITGHPFEPGCPYEMCFPKNPNSRISAAARRSAESRCIHM